MLSASSVSLICIFALIAIGSVVLMLFMFKRFDRDHKKSNLDPYYPITLPALGAQWNVRNKLFSEIVAESRSELKSWAVQNRSNYLEEDIITEFELRASNFMDDVQTRSHVNIPPYFASIIGMTRLEEIVNESRKELEEFGVAVLMGASPIYSPPYRKISIQEDDQKKIDTED